MTPSRTVQPRPGRLAAYSDSDPPLGAFFTEVNSVMLKTGTCLLTVLALSTGLGAQTKTTATVAEFAGTWNIEMMSHQVALVIEPATGNKVTATLMAMGRDTLLDGELVDGTLKLVGAKTEGSTGAATVGGGPAQHGGGDRGAQRPPARPITATLQEDGTLAGEMMTNQGPVKWTGEKLKKRKQ